MEAGENEVSAFGGGARTYITHLGSVQALFFGLNLEARAEELGLDMRRINNPSGAYFTAAEGIEMQLIIIVETESNVKLELHRICGDGTRFSSWYAPELLGARCTVQHRSTLPSPATTGNHPPARRAVASAPQPARASSGGSRRAVPIDAAPNTIAVYTRDLSPDDFLAGRNGKPRQRDGTRNACLASWPTNERVNDYVVEIMPDYAEADQTTRLELVAKTVQLVQGRFMEKMHTDSLPPHEVLWMPLGGQQWRSKGKIAKKRLRPPTPKTVIQEIFNTQLKKHLAAAAPPALSAPAAATQLAQVQASFLQVPREPLAYSQAAQAHLAHQAHQMNPIQLQGLEHGWSVFNSDVSTAVQQVHAQSTKPAGQVSTPQRQAQDQKLPGLSTSAYVAQPPTDPAQAQTDSLQQPRLSGSNADASTAVQPSPYPPTQPSHAQMNVIQQQGPGQLLRSLSNFAGTASQVHARPTEPARSQTNPTQVGLEQQLTGFGASVDATQPLLGSPTDPAQAETNSRFSFEFGKPFFTLQDPE